LELEPLSTLANASVISANKRDPEVNSESQN